MSNIVLQFGQCGSYVGKDFFNTMHNDCFLENTGLSRSDNTNYMEASLHKWFYEANQLLTPRSIIIDSDQKVTSEMHNWDNGKWKYLPENIILDSRRGCGNNWSLGYSDCGPKIIDKLLERIQGECEKCDSLKSFMTFGSTAGGTGSGVCSFVIEKLYDDYSNKPIIASFVLPYSNGDVATQNYNTILTLAACYPLCTAFIPFGNDSLHKLATSQKTDVSFRDMNNIIAEQLCCFLQPSSNSDCLHDVLLKLVPHPCYKLLTLWSAAADTEFTRLASSIKWENVLKQLRYKLNKPGETASPTSQPSTSEPSSSQPSSSQPSPTTSRRKHTRPIKLPTPVLKSVGNVVISRGSNAAQNLEFLTRTFGDQNLYPSWVPISDRFTPIFHERNFLGHHKYSLLISNNGGIHSTLKKIVEGAWSLYTHKAFLHHYNLETSGKGTMMHAFLKSESILEDYKKLYELT